MVGSFSFSEHGRRRHHQSRSDVTFLNCFSKRARSSVVATMVRIQFSGGECASIGNLLPSSSRFATNLTVNISLSFHASCRYSYLCFFLIFSCCFTSISSRVLFWFSVFLGIATLFRKKARLERSWCLDHSEPDVKMFRTNIKWDSIWGYQGELPETTLSL